MQRGCACSMLFIEDILKCVVKHIATYLCFKTNFTLVIRSLCAETAQIAILRYTLKWYISANVLI